MSRSLDILVQEMRVITQLRKVAAVLSWDQETYMPPNSAKARADQLALILSLAHSRFTGADFRNSLAQLVDLDTGQVDADSLTAEQVRMVEMTWRDWHRAKALPVEFIGKLARLTSEAQGVWQLAREKNRFDLFAPYLERIFEMKRQEADHLGFSGEPYDALLDNYEPDVTTAQIIALFDRLRPVLVDIVSRIGSDSGNGRETLLKQTFDEDSQWEFGLQVLRDMGYDMSRGRQDRSAHPFTTDFHPSDVRITTRLSENELPMGLFSSIHEGGHALYEQGLNEAHFGTPLCEPISLGIHESQSRLWENYVGRSRAFWIWYFPQLQERFPDQLSGASLDEFYAAINVVSPSLIRVEADEVTYNLHIMVRFDLERAVLNGELEVSGLPAAWSEKMQAYLGIRPQRDSEGLLQDIHWSLGALGYFPTYTLGNLYGRQIYVAANSQIHDLEGRIAKGDLKTLREWLRENIHIIGRSRTAEELLVSLSGEPLSAEPFIAYLEEKFSQLYPQLKRSQPTMNGKNNGH